MLRIELENTWIDKMKNPSSQEVPAQTGPHKSNMFLRSVKVEDEKKVTYLT